MEQFIQYAKHVGADEYVQKWVETTLANELQRDQKSTDEVEHIIDFLVQTDKKVARMSYAQAKKLTDAWDKAQQKKGAAIQECESDTETVLDFGDGFRIVKLVGENAYKREGYLMRHCVASYYGRNVEIYSLRDADNMPHCTMEQDQQIKGKGNGDIHPKYIDYVVKFLEHTGMTVGDSEMSHLGYVNIEGVDENAIYDEKYLYQGKYYQKDKVAEIKGKDGQRYQNLSLWGAFDLFNINQSLNVTFNFGIGSSVDTFRNLLKTSKQKEIVVKDDAHMAGGYRARMAGGNYAHMAGGNYARMAGGDDAHMAGGYSAHMAGGYSARMAGGDDAHMAGGYRARMAGGYRARMAGGNYAHMAGGNYAHMAGGNYAHMAGGNYARMAGGDDAHMAGGDDAHMAGGYRARMAGGNYAHMAGGNYAHMAGGDDAHMAGGNYARITMNGKNALAIAGKNAKMRGVIGSWIVLPEYNNDNDIVAMHTAMVDGKKIKENQFYWVQDGRLQEYLGDD